MQSTREKERVDLDTQSDPQAIEFPLLTIQDVARKLSVSVRTVENLIAGGDLEPIWIRRSRRFTSSQLRHFVKHNQPKEYTAANMG